MDEAGGDLVDGGRLRLAAGVGLGILTGLLVTFSAPGHGPWAGWLVLVAGVPMLVATLHVLPARQGWIAMATGYAVSAYGVGSVVFPDNERELVWGTVVAVGVIGAASGLSLRWIADRTDYRWWTAVATTGWAVMAIVRLHLPFAGTAGFLAHHLSRHPAMLQPVSVVGTVTVEAGIVLVNTSLAALVLGLVRHPSFPRARMLRIGAGLVGGLAVWTSWSLALLADPPPSLRVAAVQPGLGFETLDIDVGEVEAGDIQNPGSVIAAYDALTRQATDVGARLVVWDEMGIMDAPCDGGQVESELLALAADTDTFLVVGAGYPDDSGRWHNEAVLVTPSGECLGPYAKRHPVAWLGETLTPGDTAPVFDTELGQLGMIICYDLDFTDVSRELGSGGAQLIAAPSADWAGVARYHSAPLVFRSLENRVATVKADGLYDSAIVDPYGRIIRSAEHTSPTTEVIVADVPLSDGGRTLWNRFAVLIELAWVLAAVLIAVLVGRPLLPAGRR